MTHRPARIAQRKLDRRLSRHLGDPQGPQRLSSIQQWRWGGVSFRRSSIATLEGFVQSYYRGRSVEGLCDVFVHAMSTYAWLIG